VTRVLVLTAIDVEARGLARHLDLARVPGAAHPHFRTGVLELVGVGPGARDLEARAGGLERPALLVSAGVCGALAPHLNEGDLIELETPGGRKARAIARLTQGLHPECLAVPGILGRWVTANDRMRGKGVHFNSLIEYTFDRLDTLSAALDACVKVKISVVHRTEEEGGSHA